MQTRSKRGLWKIEQLGVLGGKALVAGSSLSGIGGLDELAELHRQFDKRLHMRTALGRVTVKQGFSGTILQYQSKFPGQIGRIAQTCPHTLTQKGRGLMAAVACQQQASVTPAFGQDRVKSVYRGALDDCIIGAEPARQQRPEMLGTL